jgi:hypothetical protein
MCYFMLRNEGDTPSARYVTPLTKVIWFCALSFSNLERAQVILERVERSQS